MGSMGSIGTVDAKFEASTGNFTASLTGVHESLGKTAAKAKEAGSQVKAALGEMTIAAQKARFAALMAADGEVSALGKVTSARERALASWRREQAQQDRAAETAAAVARAEELAALKADILARANEKLAVSANPVIASFQLMSREVGESLNVVGEKIAATAERAELSADGMAAAFGGIGKLIGIGIAGDIAAHMLDNIAELNVKLGDLHEKTGVAVQDLAGLRLAALSKGLDFETIGMGLTRLGKAMFEAKQGMLEDREAFSALGISMQEVETLSVEQMFYRISKALGENKSLVLADGTALELFGRGGKELIPVLRQWGGNLESVVKQLAKLTGVTDQSVASSQKWLEATTDLSAELHGALNPVLVSLVKHMGAIEAVGRGVWEVFLEIGGVGVAAFESIADAIHGPAAAMDDAMHGRWSAAAADTQNFAARIRQDWKDVGSVLRDNENKMMQDWKSSGQLPNSEETPDQNRPGDADGALLKTAKQDLANRERKHALTQKQLIAFWQSYLKKAKPGSIDYEQINVVLGNVMQRAGRGAASAAAKAQMEGFEQGLADLKNAHKVSVAEEYDYWASKIATLHSGSANYLKIAKEMGRLYQEVLKDQDSVNKQYAKGSLLIQPAQLIGFYGQTASPPTPLKPVAASAMSEENQRSISRESGEQVRYLQNLKRAAEARENMADGAAEAAVKLAQYRGEMSKLDAAEVLAAMHAESYNRRLDALNDSLAAIRNSGQRPELVNAESLGVQKEIDQLRGARAAQAIQDQAAINDATLSGSIRNALQLYVADAQDAATQISQILISAFEQVNSSLADSLMAHAYNGREYRRNIEQGLSNTARGIGSEVLGTGIKHVEGSILGRFGFGPKAKMGESESNALWVRIARANVSGGSASVLDVIKGFAGQPSGLSTTSKTVGSMIPLLSSVLPGFAEGGIIQSNLPSIVGERGPELFVPSTSGRIVPNDQLGFGETHIHHNVYVDARGAHDPAAIEAAAHRAVMTAAPHIAAAAMRGVKEDRLRKPSTVR